MNAIARLAVLSVVVVCGCSSTPAVLATWYLSRNCDREREQSQRECRDRENPPKLYLGLLNRGSTTVPVSHLMLNGNHRFPVLGGPQGWLLEPGQITFFELKAPGTDVPGQTANAAYFQCHLPVSVTIHTPDEKPLDVETISTMPSSLAETWRKGCLYPPL